MRGREEAESEGHVPDQQRVRGVSRDLAAGESRHSAAKRGFRTSHFRGARAHLERANCIRPRAAQRGQYGLPARNETKARPTPHIMHNKLRLSYKERRSEFEEPFPPGANFALNGLNSGRGLIDRNVGAMRDA